MHLRLFGTKCSVDSEGQIDEFINEPEKNAKYCRDIEGELNKRFTLVSRNHTASRICLDTF